MMEVKHNDQLKKDWIKPLFTDMDYKNQWAELTKQLTKNEVLH
jgi:hypothetical protein